MHEETMSSIHERLVTVEEMGRAPYADRHVELVAGRVVEMSPAFARHGALAAKIHQKLAVWTEARGAGLVLSADTGFILARNPDTLRAPDVAFVRAGRPLPAHGFFDGAPDVAIEVLSDSNRAGEVARKVRDYLSAGAQQVWIVDPDEKAVDVHTPTGYATVRDLLDGGVVLPGFRLDIAALFAL